MYVSLYSCMYIYIYMPITSILCLSSARGVSSRRRGWKPSYCYTDKASGTLHLWMSQRTSAYASLWDYHTRCKQFQETFHMMTWGQMHHTVQWSRHLLLAYPPYQSWSYRAVHKEMIFPISKLQPRRPLPVLISTAVHYSANAPPFFYLSPSNRFANTFCTWEGLMVKWLRQPLNWKFQVWRA